MAIQQMADANELTTNRLFLGKRWDDSAMLLLSDIKGKPRIRLVVMPDGDAKLEFMDETGKVTHSLPEKMKK